MEIQADRVAAARALAERAQAVVLLHLSHTLGFAVVTISQFLPSENAVYRTK